MSPGRRLLVFNLATDADDPILGFTTRWLASLATRVGQVDVITMRRGRLDLPANVEVLSLGKEDGLSEPRRAARFYRLLAGLLRSRRYDGCFAHMTPLFALMAAPLLKPARIPTTLWYTHGASSRVLRLAVRAVDRVVTASGDSFPVPTDKLLVTGHGIDTQAFAPATEPAQAPAQARDDGLLVTTLGRLSRIKRIDLLIDAAAILRAEGEASRFQFRVVGPDLGGIAGELRRRAAGCGVADAFTFAGPVAPLAAVTEHRRADVEVNLSETRSLDKSVLEAMACAAPVLTSNLAFAPLLSPIDAALMVQPNAAAVAEGLRRLDALGAAERGALGQRLRQAVVEHHSLDALADALVADVLFRPAGT